MSISMAISISSSRRSTATPSCCATTATAPLRDSSPSDPAAALHGFAWADFDGEGVPDAACLDASRSRADLRQSSRWRVRGRARPGGARDAAGGGRWRPHRRRARGSRRRRGERRHRGADARGGCWRRGAVAGAGLELARSRQAAGSVGWRDDGHGAVAARRSGQQRRARHHRLGRDTQVLLGGGSAGFTAMASPIALRTYAVGDLQSTSGDPALPASGRPTRSRRPDTRRPARRGQQRRGRSRITGNA